MNNNQITIKKKLVLDGLGLHSGVPVKLKFFPAEIDTGIVFLRTDIKKSEEIKSYWKNVIPSNLCTKISNNKNQSISTIEHLMFALYGLGITNVYLEIDGPEVPILDGSAKIFIDELLKTGLVEQKKKNKVINILKKIELEDNNKSIRYQPTGEKFLELEYHLNYSDEFIKQQSFTFKNTETNLTDISMCRTFCHQQDLEKIFAMGLAKGGSLDNAIVISGNKVLNQDGLRCPLEFVKHKILDCLGDLYLSGFFITGKIICNQGGHELTSKFLKKIFENRENYSIIN